MFQLSEVIQKESNLLLLNLVQMSVETSALKYKGNQSFGQVAGSTYSYQNVQNLDIKFGRFISYADNETRRKVIVIGDKLREDLELPANPVGEFIGFAGEWLKIVGLAEPKGSFFGFSQDNFAIFTVQHNAESKR